MKKVAIVGIGRFANVLIKLLGNDFNVELFHGRDNNTDNIKKLYKNDVIFYCVPISAFEAVIRKHKKYFMSANLLIDVLSVKVHPKKILEKHLKGTGATAMLTHPMFGPDSSRNGFAGLPIMMDRFMSREGDYLIWKKYFSGKGLKVVEMSAEKHDRLAASSQGLTHFIGRMLDAYGFENTEIDTLGAKKLHEVVDQTCNDNLRLFRDLQKFNPFTKEMRVRLGTAYDKLYARLLPVRVDRKKTIIGIQGGKGSFNEEAAIHITGQRNIRKPKLKYLYTTERVLRQLGRGEIDHGVFAIQNSVGGMVTESAYAMAKYRFRIVEEFTIPIRHYLMKRKDVVTDNLQSVMAHPQVFRQCRKTLPEKYPRLNTVSGSGDMIDTARAAMALANGEIPKETAILGPKKLAGIYGLEIIEGDLQDNTDGNLTSFFLVSR